MLRLRIAFILSNLFVLASCVSVRMKKGLEIGNKDSTFVVSVEKGGRRICAGILVHKMWVLTLASCIDKSMVFAYNVRFKSKTSEDVTHPIESTETVDHELIMLRMWKPMTREEEGVRTFSRFSTKSLDKSIYQCRVFGFSNDLELKKAKLEVSEPEKCRDVKTLCFDIVSQGRVCQKDNGAPIVCKIKRKWHIVGFSSVDTGCEKKDVNGVRMSYFTNSIQKVIKRKTDGICNSFSCTVAGDAISKRMDLTIDPCDNFYDFACGKFIKDNMENVDGVYRNKNAKMEIGNQQIDESVIKLLEKKLTNIGLTGFGGIDQSENAAVALEMILDIYMQLSAMLQLPDLPSDLEAVSKARQFFATCISSAPLGVNETSPIYKYMEDAGGMPVLEQGPGGNWNATEFTIEDLLIKTQLTSIIAIGVTMDKRDGKRDILAVEPADLNLARHHYLGDRDSQVLMSLERNLQTLYVTLGANNSLAAEYAKHVVDLEVDLAKIMRDFKFPYEVNDYIDMVNVADLDTVSEIALERVLKAVLLQFDATLKDTDTVEMFMKDYFQQLPLVLNKYHDSVIATYAVGQRALRMFEYLPISGSPSSPSRTLFSCYLDVLLYMSNAVGRLYIENFFTQETRNKATALMKQIKEVSRLRINRSWLSDQTKRSAKAKLRSMTYEIGYPDVYFDDEWLNKIYENATVYTDDIFATVLSFTQVLESRNFQSIGQEHKTSESWRYSASIVNAYYGRVQNHVYILAGIIRQPLFDVNYQEYLNYGPTGALFGHEILHGYDYIGRQFDETGSVKNWWSRKDKRQYKERVQCMIDQYDGFVVAGTGGRTVNGEQTLNENIADNGAVKIAYKAYRNWVRDVRGGEEEDRLPGLDYTPDQMFFISLAQKRCELLTYETAINRLDTGVHSPGRFRIIGPLQNYEEFAKTWNCPAGSYMNPKKKCSIW